MSERRFTRRSDRDLVRVGVITGNGGHTLGIWGEKMNPTGDFIRTTGMILTHVWSVRPQFAAQVAGKFRETVAVEDPRDMIGQVDGVIVDDITAISLYPALSRPFLEAGIPTFVNRPFATSLAKGREMIDCAEKHGAALYTMSSWEASESIGDLRLKLANMGAIKGYVAHNSASDYYSHGLHGVWYIYAALREEIEKGRVRLAAAAYHTHDWRTPGGVIVFEHEGPQGPFHGALHQVSGADGNGYMRVFGPAEFGDAEGRVPASPQHFMYNTWNSAQLVLQEMFETGRSPETGETMMEKLRMFLLPFYSVLEKGGEMARLEEIENWEVPRPSEALMKDGHPTDSAFRVLYSDDEIEAVARGLGAA